ncbi:hypothetical protein JVT61DRAFT_11011 [Boletus reticuloceps]|uniref:HNH nuclease domain-containing protein n=1 Tax=Boletus reticuloceps TaxID=495285 RepID=A0A8I3A572_9AGAM|nr:hypothetical protein JVT61DRAFT_11011 [Boletus reticuloceps]
MAVVLAMWTGQVKNSGTRDLATTNAQPDGSQQPESPMPPKRRSQTTRSRPPLEKHIGKLESENDILSRAQQSSPEYGPMEERREAEGIAANTTPRYKRTKTSTVRTEKREQAPDDPNNGRCLITNRPKPVELCHLVPRATDHETLTKMEYVWEEGYQQLNVDSKHNLLHLRADWHYLFNTSEWVLVPEAEIVKELSKIYLEEKCTTRDLAKLFVKKSYRYYVLPSPTLNEPICRFPDVNEDNHKTLFPPFANLGVLESHIHPQFVIFNTGQKLRDLSVDDYIDMISFLEQMVPHEGDASDMLNDTVRLYSAWTKANIPADYCNLIGTSKRAHPPSGQGQDDASSVTDDTVVEDDTDWIEYIHKWQKESDGVAGKWESGELHDSRDEQLTAYGDEHARTPPSPGVWDSWKPTWGSRSRDPKISDRSQFSSNDWAVFKNDVYLTRLEYPQVDL